MQAIPLKSISRIGLLTGVAAILYLLSDQLLIYRYFKTEYYIAAIGIIALATGVILTRRYYAGKAPASITAGALLSPLHTLTAKELLVLELIYLGKSNKEIAALNFVEISTIKTHINHVFAKLAVNNRREASKLYAAYADSENSTLSPPVTG